MDGNQDYRGVLSRRKGIFSSWVKFTYVKKDGALMEFKLGANHFTSEPLQVIDLQDALIEDAHLITGKPSSFAIHASYGKTFFFLAPNLDEKEKWLRHLTAATRFSTSSSSIITPSRSSNPSISGASQRSNTSSASSAAAPPTPFSSSQSANRQIPSSSSQHSFDRASQQSSSTQDDLTADFPSQISVDSHITPAELETMMPVLRYLESFTDAVVVGNINGMVVAINSAAEKLFCLTKAQVQGEPLTILMPDPYKSQHDGYLFRHEKFGSEKLIGKTRNLKGERRGETFDLQISLGKLPVKGYFIATIRELDPAVARRTEYAD